MASNFPADVGRDPCFTVLMDGLLHVDEQKD